MLVNPAKGALLLCSRCGMMALEVKNIFNSANWNRIRSMLAETGVPGYLASLVDSLVIFLSARSSKIFESSSFSNVFEQVGSRYTGL